MQVSKIITESLSPINSNGNLTNEITGIFACDLLSHVMGNAKEGQILVTVLNNINVLGVASLLDLSAVIFTHGVPVNQQIIDKANDLEIPLLTTKMTTAEIVISLHTLGV